MYEIPFDEVDAVLQERQFRVANHQLQMEAIRFAHETGASRHRQPGGFVGRLTALVLRSRTEPAPD